MSRLVEHPAACEDTPELIAHVLERYHETHRRELPELVALAEKVEAVHGTDPNAPHGLAEALRAILSELEIHMKKEDLVLFPSMQRGGANAVAEPIAVSRHDHDEQEQALARIAAMTHGFRLPKDACRSWRRLYAGARKLVEGLDEHIRLENDVLFPRFENTAWRRRGSAHRATPAQENEMILPPKLIAPIFAGALLLGAPAQAQETDQSWLPTLITDTPAEGFDLAVSMARKAVTTTQTDTDALHKLRPAYSHDPASLIDVSGVVADYFATIAEANDYWRE